jgi:lysophospholipase L1-like esterase
MVCRCAVLVTGLLAWVLTATTINAAIIGQPIACGAFANADLPKPTPQTDPEAVERFHAINREAEARSHTIVFLGDSLTRKWDRSLWEQHFARLNALNAGVNGDRTEHLLWRIEHGNLAGQKPELVVILIGTNDIGRDRPPEIIAEGVREILVAVRAQLPASRILLLAVLPRTESPGSERRRQVAAVNQLIRTCADRKHVFYADVGDALLDRAGRLTREVSPDGVHLSERGYVLFTERLEDEFGSLPPMK